MQTENKYEPEFKKDPELMMVSVSDAENVHSTTIKKTIVKPSPLSLSGDWGETVSPVWIQFTFLCLPRVFPSSTHFLGSCLTGGETSAISDVHARLNAE